MKPIQIHPLSVLAGMAMTSLAFIALGAQVSVVPGHFPPQPVEVYYPPIPISSLEYFPYVNAARYATAQDVVTVNSGEHLVMVGAASSGTPFRWPLTDADGDERFDSTYQGLSQSPCGMPTAILPPGQYVFAYIPNVDYAGSPPERIPDAYYGFRVR